MTGNFFYCYFIRDGRELTKCLYGNEDMKVVIGLNTKIIVDEETHESVLDSHFSEIVSSLRKKTCDFHAVYPDEYNEIWIGVPKWYVE